jgi:CubicO group peptidase (beta-lactamase class C family)
MTRHRKGPFNMGKFFLSAILWCLVTTSSSAQSSVAFAELDAYIETARSEWQVPGLAVAIVKGGEVVFIKGYGVREVGKGELVDDRTLFAIASNTKAFTSAALAILVDEGKLQWGDLVIDHLPYFGLYSPYVTQDMRVRDLLCHRSGLGTFSGDLVWYGTRYSRGEVIRRARHLMPRSGFRERYGYSNIMFLTAGELVPAVAGRSWDDFVREEFFEPLGMIDTATSVGALEGRANVATPHGEKDGHIVTFPWYDWDNIAPAGGILSNVNDMARWIMLQLGRGTLEGKTYFSKEASRTMWTVHTPLPVSKESEERYPTTHFRGYGLGWSLMDYQGRKIVSHGGGYDGMFSRVAMVPEENLGMVILTNSMTSLPAALSYRILDMFLATAERDWSAEFLERSKEDKEKKAKERAEKEASRVAGTQSSLPLEKYTGTYGGAFYGDAIVVLEKGSLALQLLPNPDLKGKLSHWHYDTFEVAWEHDFPWFGKGTVQFLLDATGKVVEMKMDVPNDDFWFTELELKRREEPPE